MLLESSFKSLLLVSFLVDCVASSVTLLLHLATNGNTKLFLPEVVSALAFLDSDSDSGALFFFRRFILGGDIFIDVAVCDVETSETTSGCVQLRVRRGGTEVDRLNETELQPTSATGNTSSSSSGVGQRAVDVDSLLGRSADGSGGPVSVLDFRSRPFPVPQTSLLVTDDIIVVGG